MIDNYKWEPAMTICSKAGADIADRQATRQATNPEPEENVPTVICYAHGWQCDVANSDSRPESFRELTTELKQTSKQ